MTNFEDKLRELAEKVENGSDSVAFLSSRILSNPETVKLVADVIAAARTFWKSPLDYTESRYLEQALAALDTHAAKKEATK